VLQQRRLADAGLTAQDQDLALTRSDILKQSIEGNTLTVPPTQRFLLGSVRRVIDQAWVCA
jgi:hypothetical protein